MCLFYLLTIHDKALHYQEYLVWELIKWVGTRVEFEFSLTSKFRRLVMTSNNSIDEPNGL